jgi:hypothetical protein
MLCLPWEEGGIKIKKTFLEVEDGKKVKKIIK